MKTIITPTDTLIVVDIQNDFIPGGSLAVGGGDQIVPGVNGLIDLFYQQGGKVVLSQDWHPKNHRSFASLHSGKSPFDPITGIKGIGPVLWPDHCVQGTRGAEFHDRLDVNKANLIIRKGLNPAIDSYSVFMENDRESETGLTGYLKSLAVTRIFLCGLATDYCVFWSAMDGVKMGFETAVLLELSRGIAEETTESAKKEMAESGIIFIDRKVISGEKA